MLNRQIVPPEGKLTSKIALVGEAPGKDEVEELRPFVGSAGRLLNQLLGMARIYRADCYIDNVVQERPDDNNIKEFIQFTSKHVITTAEYDAYEAALYERLQKTEANIVVALGAVPLWALTRQRNITKRRGSIYWSPFIEKKVVACIHPAAALRTFLDRHLILFDLKKAQRESTYPEMPKFSYDIVLEPTFDQVYHFLKTHLCQLSLQTWVSVDIEVVNRQLSCIALSPSPDSAMVIPFVKGGQPYFNPDQEVEVMELLAKFLENPRIPKLFQNGVFDTSFLYDRYGICTQNVEDTMLAQKIAAPDFPGGLDFIASIHTYIPYYKDEGKQYFKQEYADRTFWEYNAKDSLVTSIAFPKQLEELGGQGNIETYNTQRSLIEPLVFMGLVGMKVDVEQLAVIRKAAESEREVLRAQLDNLTESSLNINSPKQVREYFYGRLGLSPYTTKGKVTVDENALTRIARKGYEEAHIILQLRKIDKLLNTYINVRLNNDRLRCTYTPITLNRPTGRVSSSEDIFGFGTNMQNWPHDTTVGETKFNLDNIFLADTGYLIGTVDLSQADNRSVAFIAGEERMMSAFTSGTDVHSMTAHLVFGIPYEEVRRQAREGIKCPIGYGDKTYRDWGKRLNHALNFDMSADKFSLMTELPLRLSRQLVEEYHSIYPAVRRNFHQSVVSQLQRNRTLTNCFGRSRLFLDRWSDDLFRKAYSFIPQSNTADVINRWGLLPFYYEERFKDVWLMRQVHDSIDFQIPRSLGAFRIAELLKEMKDSLERELNWKGRKFVIPAEFKLGATSLGDRRSIKFDDTLVLQIEAILKGEQNAKNTNDSTGR